MKHFTRQVIVEHAALIFLSAMFVYMLSYSTSPRYDFLGGDSAVFQAIGKFWAQGVLPYVELFDQKGPLIFFLNALGYTIHPREGLIILQIICMYLSCVMLWRGVGLYWRGRERIFFFALIMIYYAGHYWEGNNASEYTMPFLAASMYCFLRYLSDGKNFCPPLYGFVYGVSFGACVMLRASNAMPTCCVAFLTALFLLKARAFKNLWQNLLSFCAGAAVIILPFVVYFAAHGALYDMLYGTILFNVTYATQGKVDYELAQRLRVCGVELMPAVLMIFFGALRVVRNVEDKLAWSAIFVGVMVSTLLLNLRMYYHYYMIVAPTMPLLAAVLKPPPKLRKPILFVTVLYSATCFFIWLFVFGSHFLPTFRDNLNYETREERRGIQRLERLIPDAERNSFACWGNFYSTSHWMLATGMKPRERFFMNNSVLALLAPEQKAEWLQNVTERPPLWILYGTPDKPKAHLYIDDHRPDPDVERLLAEKYILCGKTIMFDQVMGLYRLKGR